MFVIKWATLMSLNVNGGQSSNIFLDWKVTDILQLFFFFFEEILFYIPLQPLTWHHQSKGWNFVIWEMNPRTPWGSLISLCNDGDTKIRDGEKKRDKRV